MTAPDYAALIAKLCQAELNADNGYSVDAELCSEAAAAIADLVQEEAHPNRRYIVKQVFAMLGFTPAYTVKMCLERLEQLGRAERERDEARAREDALRQDAARVEYLESLRMGAFVEIEDTSGYDKSGVPEHVRLPQRWISVQDENDELLGSGPTLRAAIDDAMHSCPSGTNGSLDLMADRVALNAAKGKP